ncbi:Hypothetical protein NCDO2118_2279 [Lactococcus lactis subsp. lactis NCDO 2118]|uniref:Aldose 1-epimerase n=1 Tax=Lactococcus lactis subsp. lactis NCDO 2118 TaxID=1117941 RepID=A0ABC8A971_LACLL|nr:DUF1912 family protein [Lactococcus lactis]ADA65970.1 Hypothetical protein LLKF_2421 [Lactococcus lactis subsp. lactis KF147]AII13731.1 Hypothetical protein NCDO2118_2279 [Lactococcus lactis subsp. lactis NCDO 2118]
MTYEQNFLKDFQEWVDQQVQISELAMKAAEKIATEDGKKEAQEAAIRYESRLDAYQFLQGKFENYENGKDFHDVPDFGTKTF